MQGASQHAGLLGGGGCRWEGSLMLQDHRWHATHQVACLDANGQLLGLGPKGHLRTLREAPELLARTGGTSACFPSSTL